MSKVLEGAPAATPAATDQPTETQFDLSKWTAEQRQQWALTGEEPKEISSPAKEETPAATPKGEELKPTLETGPDKEKQEPAPQPRDRYVARKDRKIGELSAQLRQAQRELDDLKKRGSNAATPTVSDKPNSPDGRPVRPEEPDLTAFDNLAAFKEAQKEYRTKFAAYEDARDEYNRKQWDSKHQESTTKSAAENESKVRIESFDKRAADFQKTQKDYDETTKSSKAYEAAFTEVREALADAHPAPEVVDALLEMGPEAIHYFGNKLEELDRILEYPTQRALRELGKVEAGLAKAPKPKLVSDAPRPGSRVGATTQATGDPIEDAYARGDFALGAKLESQRDVERSKRR